jgi:acetolactate synthase-1/2/3 large subunit
VGNAFRFQDTFDNRHPLYAGDVGIGINPRLAARIKDSRPDHRHRPAPGRDDDQRLHAAHVPAAAQKLVHIHASAEELGRVYQADLAMCATMRGRRAALEALTAPPSVPWERLGPPCTPTTWPTCSRSRCPAHRHARHRLPRCKSCCRRCRLTNGAGNFASWTHRFFRHHGPGQGPQDAAGAHQGAMGYGVPAGMGAASITTGRTVFTIAGDGDFLMNGQELATAVQYGGKSIIVLLNNGMYGTIRMHQEREYPQHVSGSQLHNPDFAALARAYGYAGVRITRTAQFEPELLAALAGSRARPQGTLK